MKKILSLLLCVSLIFALCACSGTSTAKPVAPSQEPESAITVKTTENPATTPEPTEEPKDAGLKIPDEIPDSYVYEGSGDSVIKIDTPEGLHVLYVKGNAESRHFAVKGYTESGESTELFVNTTEPYEGVTIDPSQETSTLEISSKGPWQIEVRSIYTCDILDDSAPYEGEGDTILLVNSKATIAEIVGNEDGRHFAVKSYGERSNLMVNTTDPYSGTVMMKYKPVVIEVSAVGSWSITLS